MGLPCCRWALLRTILCSLKLPEAAFQPIVERSFGICGNPAGSPLCWNLVGDSEVGNSLAWFRQCDDARQSPTTLLTDISSFPLPEESTNIEIISDSNYIVMTGQVSRRFSSTTQSDETLR